MALPSASRIDLADILNYEDLMRNGEKVRWNELASVGLFLFESIHCTQAQVGCDNEVGIEDREGEEEIMTEMGQKGRGRER
jgi:hypothetical protein